LLHYWDAASLLRAAGHIQAAHAAASNDLVAQLQVFAGI
jgi:hypothetical protein